MNAFGRVRRQPGRPLSFTYRFPNLSRSRGWLRSYINRGAEIVVSRPVLLNRSCCCSTGTLVQRPYVHGLATRLLDTRPFKYAWIETG